MNSDNLPLRLWLEKEHLKIVKKNPAPPFISEYALFAACVLLVSHLLRQLRAMEVGLGVFEATRRPGDDEAQAKDRVKRAEARVEILKGIVGALEREFPQRERESAALTWTTALEAAPRAANTYQSKILYCWERKVGADKFVLLGGHLYATGRWGGEPSLEHLAACAMLFSGRGTLRSCLPDPDEFEHLQEITVKQARDAIDRMKKLCDSSQSWSRFLLTKANCTIPGFVCGLHPKPSLIGKVKRPSTTDPLPATSDDCRRGEAEVI